MGLSIHYSGNIINEELIDPLIEEVTDICKTLAWKCHLFDASDDDLLKGVCFYPSGSEPVFLTFVPGGRMCSPANMMSDTYDGVQFDKELQFTTSAKTQYAGADAHIAIIKLLKYISGKYLTNFKLRDEGNYWETSDEKILYDQFEKYNSLPDAVGDSLSDINTTPGETPVSLVERIEKILKGKFNRDAE